MSASPRRMGSTGLRRTLSNSDGVIDLASILVGVLVLAIIAGITSVTLVSSASWSQDRISKQALSAVASAQQSVRAVDGDYFAYDSKTGSNYQKLADDPALIEYAGRVIVDIRAGHWLATARSDSGSISFQTSESKSQYTVAPNDTNPQFPAGKVPKSFGNAELKKLVDATRADRAYDFSRSGMRADQIPGYSGPAVPDAAQDPLPTPAATATVAGGFIKVTATSPATGTQPLSYDLYRKVQGAAGAASLLLTFPAGTTANDTTVVSNTTYDYYVVGVNDSLRSANSAVTSAKIAVANPFAVFTISELASSPAINWYDIATSSDGTKVAAIDGTYPGTGQGTNGATLWQSSDSGATWKVNTAAGRRYWNAIDMSADGTKIITVGVSGNIFLSTNSGTTWTQKTITGRTTTSWADVTMSADGTKIAIVPSSDTNMYISTDSGATFKAAGTGGIYGEVSISDDGLTIFAVTRSDRDSGGLPQVSVNGGTTFRSLSSLPFTYWDGVDVSADGKKMLTSNDQTGLLYSSDSGGTWKSIAPVGVVTGAVSDDGLKIVAFGPSSQVWTSTNAGATWVKTTTPGYRRVDATGDAKRAFFSTYNKKLGTGVYTEK